MRLLLILFAMLVSAAAWAAQDTTVVLDNAPIRAEPRDGTKILEYLPVGTEIRVSSFPLDGGWYKVRARGGQYGWVHESFLSVTKMADPNDDSESAELTMNEEKPRKAEPERDRKWFLRGFYGMQFQQAADLNDLFNFSEFNTAVYLGGEFGHFTSEKVALLARVDYIYKDVTARETITSNTYNLGIRSMPVMLGGEYYLMKLPPFRLSLGAMAGLAFNTQFTSVAISQAAPNSVTLSDRPFTMLVRLNATRPLGRTFSVFGEAGYRYLVTKELSSISASSTNGGQVFLKNGSYKNRIIDLSGFTIAAGLGIHF